MSSSTEHQQQHHVDREYGSMVEMKIESSVVENLWSEFTNEIVCTIQLFSLFYVFFSEGRTL